MTASTAAALRIDRTFDAPVEEVWDAWTRPERIARWWNPSPAHDAVVHEADVRPGGRLRLTMTLPEAKTFAGTDTFPVLGTYVVVRPPHEIALDLSDDEHDEPLRIVARFEAVGGRTRMTFEIIGDVEPDMLARMDEGWRACFGRLAAVVEREAPIVVERVIRAPREQVWRAWTEPATLSAWWAPPGGSAAHVTVDLRVGGRFHYLMRLPDGTEIWGRGEYRELRAPERLSYVDAFSDAEGNVVSPTRYGMSASHPVESLVTVDLAEVEDGTRVTLRHAIATDVVERQGTLEGWTGMLEALARVVGAAAPGVAA